ncbi:hypothetical protein R75461_04987 [Paraburkholderia nemoris]|uniref:site-specific integrase n=1 Tax=Paraburkholderia nemoris TaxID=2793076 RepID=UPI001909A180|nr:MULTISPECIES: site-specific integrase [Paraburkholderia]MBK3780769.1 site-specific integrase [Paraburkholderia aspalathi]CAE6796727.1 hypothetical protein R75461_04987 [Paraburkholderia nemoris]
MHDDPPNATLTRGLDFPAMDYGPRQVPITMCALLFRGGARQDRRNVERVLQSGDLGPEIPQRIPLVIDIHRYLTAELVAGGSPHTLRDSVDKMRWFYTYADELGVDPDKANVRWLFNKWTRHLQDQIVARRLKKATAFQRGTGVSRMLAAALDTDRNSITRGSHLQSDSSKKKSLGVETDKQNLQHTFEFGNDIIDIIQCLTATTCLGPLPVPISLRSGATIPLWCGLIPEEKVRALTAPELCMPHDVKEAKAVRERRSNDNSVSFRRPIINFRIQAEFLLFISQTGMNAAPACALKIGDFRYESFQNGYRVRKYKNRKRGGVEFEIFSEYRPLFERYLEFRSEFFPTNQTDLLFPLTGDGSQPNRHGFRPQSLKKFFRSVGRIFVNAKDLRQTRINWLLRQTDDPGIVAELGQHSEQTMFRSYIRPNHQRAIREWSEFFAAYDSHLESPAPGSCEERAPLRSDAFVSTSPQPDCKNPAGCLFCFHYRGINNFDYVWSLFSFRELKILELANYKKIAGTSVNNPVMMSVERVTDIVDELKQKGTLQHEWWSEAQSRMLERHHHPRWAGFISLSEMLG